MYMLKGSRCISLFFSHVINMLFKPETSYYILSNVFSVGDFNIVNIQTFCFGEMTNLVIHVP